MAIGSKYNGYRDGRVGTEPEIEKTGKVKITSPKSH